MILPTAKQFLANVLKLGMVLGTCSSEGCGKSRNEAAQTPSAQGGQAQQAPATTQASPTADELYQLLAPIALFPDNLVAQVLAGSTYPDQITAAHAWIQQNASLKGDQLMQAADKQPWEMATNLSWTSALGAGCRQSRNKSAVVGTW